MLSRSVYCILVTMSLVAVVLPMGCGAEDPSTSTQPTAVPPTGSSPAVVGSAGQQVGANDSPLPASEDEEERQQFLSGAKVLDSALALSDRSSFEALSAAPTECTLSARSCRRHWPSETNGRVEAFESLERFGDQTHSRSFTLYIPKRVRSPVPVVILLHGGQPLINEPGASMFADVYDELADGRPVSWGPNRRSCYLDTSGPEDNYRTPAGDPCEPELASVTNSQPFLIVYPDGLIDVDGSGRHWEDGRVPSPGSGRVGQRRDDVGFIDHIIDRLLEERSDIVDAERIYLAGYSNGGFMTSRVACESSRLGRRVSRIAAHATIIATMAEALVSGTDERPRCAPGGVDQSIAFFLGKDIDTPNCESFGCSAPVESGDGRVIFGETGGVYTVNSPDGGATWNAPDTIERFARAQEGWRACSVRTRSESLGLFTTRTVHRSSESRSEVVLFETSGGRHGANVGRSDYLLSARVLDFLFGFRRRGLELLRPPNATLSGDY